jgi:hypothetical protein
MTYYSRGPLPVHHHANGRYTADGFVCETLPELAVSLRAFGWSLSTQLAMKKAGSDEVLRETSIHEILAEYEAEQKAKEDAA